MKPYRLFVLLVVLFLIPSISLAETVVSGPITEDTTWTMEGSPYIVTGDIVVRHAGCGEAATLTIEPGVTVRFNPGTGLTVGKWIGDCGSHYGALLAQGTEASPIIFTSNAESPAPGDWKGIFFEDQTNDEMTILEHCRIMYGGQTHNANVYLLNARLVIKRSIISQSSHSGLYVDGPGCNNAAITCVSFTDNQYGVTTVNEGFPRVQQCNFVENAIHGFNNLGTLTIEAENNWWGDAQGPNQAGDTVYGNVAFEPWLTSETDCVLRDVVSPEVRNLRINGEPFEDNHIVYNSSFITFDVDDLSGIHRVDFLINGNLIRSATEDSSLNSFYLDISSLVDGSHTVSIIAYDPIGNATTLDVPITLAFNAPIIAGMKQMELGEQQTLSIMNYKSGNAYTWTLVSGGGSLESDPENPAIATYAAPEANPGCSNNPTVRVTDGNGNYGELNITVNAMPTSGPALGIKTQVGECLKVHTSSGFPITNISVNVKTYRCDGSILCDENFKINKSGTECPEYHCPCEGICDEAVIISCGGAYEYWEGAACGDWVDLRTPEMIAAGCCPPEPPPPSEDPPEDNEEGDPCDKNPDQECTCNLSKTGNPISVYNGNNIETEEDLRFVSAGQRPLRFIRYYNSRAKKPGLEGPLGYGWTHNYNITLDPDYVHKRWIYLKILDETGRGYYFRHIGDGKTYVGAFKEQSSVEKIDDTFIWSIGDGRRYGFTLEGRLSWMEDSMGNRIELTYDAGDRPYTITDKASGRALSLQYNENGAVESILGPVTEAVPDGIWVRYGYDALRNLTSIAYADGSGFDYSYNDPKDSHNLTEKKNKAGHLLSSWTYDDKDRAVENFTRDGRGVTIDYVNETEVRVTDAYGVVRTYTIGNMEGKKRVTDITGPSGCPTCGSDVVRIEYDRALRVIETEYANGSITQYGNYDRRGNPGTITEAVGTPDETTTTFTYHPEISIKTRRSEPSILGAGNKVTVWDYDDDGNDTPNENPTRLLHRKIESGFTKNAAGAVVPYEYITRYTYNSKGQVLTLDGPLAGEADKTYFTYAEATGDLLSITSPVVGTTDYAGYDAAGNHGRITDPNGNSFVYAYDGRGRVKTITDLTDGSVTDYTYNDAGDLLQVTGPNGVASDFEYDDTYGRLVKVSDPLDNYISYAYDNQGNRIEKSLFTAAAERVFYQRFDYQHPDHPGKLWREINPEGAFTEYDYDAMGNIRTITDPNENSTAYAYNDRNLLTDVFQPGNLVTTYAYDTMDNLTSVTDAENKTTHYTYDDAGRMLSTISPDTGATTYAYDAAGNLIAKTDANGTTVTYTYDAADRLTAIRFPDSSQDILYTYDVGTNGKGRLTGMTDPAGNFTYTYDGKGNLVREDKIIESITYVTQYTYDEAGVLTGITYPNGRTVTYGLDEAGRVDQVSTEKDGISRPVAQSIQYLPYGPISSITYGNGAVLNQSFDLLLRPATITAGGLVDYTYDTDPAGNITAIAENLDAARSRSFAYDDLNRLISATGIFGTVGYAYDRVGNRLTKSENGQTDTYTYQAGTHQLVQVSGQNARSFTYDANGNTTEMDSTALSYNQNDRLIRIAVNGGIMSEYTYNANGQRIKKTAKGKTILFHYDRFGNLIAESDAAGNFTREYIYLNTLRLSAFAEEAAQAIQVEVSTDKGRMLSNIKVYAFTESGAYTGKFAVTDESGTAEFALDDFTDGRYRFRADYLSGQFWSDVISLPGNYAAAVQIQEETATLAVTQAGMPVAGVKVYLFNDAGAYLGRYEITDVDGMVRFDLPVDQAYKFRADFLGSQYMSQDLLITESGPNTSALETGGGLLQITADKGEGSPLAGIKVYLFNDRGSYLGLNETTDAEGKVYFTVSSGAYNVRADYLGYQFWLEQPFDVTGDSEIALSIPHADVTVAVEGKYGEEIEARENLKVYLFTPTGAFLGQYRITDANGEVSFSLPNEKAYKVRADYLSHQFWSDEFTGTDAAVTIEEGTAAVSVTGSGNALEGVKVYLFSPRDAYLGWYGVSDAYGKVYFRLPDGEYKFRADYMGSRYWSGAADILPHQENPVSISTGGGAFSATILKGADEPLVGAECDLFDTAGSYLGKSGITNSAGEVGFDLSSGDYKIRIDHLGYQFWTAEFTVPTALSLEHTIAHQDVTITVDRDFAGNGVPGANLKTYLFKPAGAYLGINQVTDAAGRATFSLPQAEYQVRVDYLLQQFWSPVFTAADTPVVIQEGMADVRVIQETAPLGSVNVYVFSASGAYLGLSGKTDADGKVDFRLPAAGYQFRADHQGCQYWGSQTITADQINRFDLNTGGGQFQLTVQKAAGEPMTGIKVYAFSSAGSYLGMSGETDAEGQVSFALSDGAYMFRVDYLGYQFWTDVCGIPGDSSGTLTIEHQHITTTVNQVFGTEWSPLTAIKVYLFTESGAYMGTYATTDASGQIVFSLPEKAYKLRADYLGSKFWSEVITWQDADIDVNHGKVNIHVTENGDDIENAPVYLFTEAGSYLGKYLRTDASGMVSFMLPEASFKFRVDFNGSKYWSDSITPAPHGQTEVYLALEDISAQLTNDPDPIRFDGTPPEKQKIMLASLGTITGLISQTVVAKIPEKKIYYYLNDHLGTPIIVIDDTNTVVWSADYKPFGEVDIQVDTFENNFRFPGQYYDNESNLHYNYHRYYQPQIGRYLRIDPLRTADAINLYAYVSSSPLNYIDPKGLAGIAIDFGGSYITGWGSTSGKGGGAGTGFYFGAKDWYAEFGGFTYQQFTEDTGKSPAASIGAGANITLYFKDAEKFFPDKMNYTKYVFGPFAMTFSEDPCSSEVTGITFSLGGKGFGWAIHEKGISQGLQKILQ